MRRIFITYLAISATLIQFAWAQFPEDALRYSSIGLGVGARSLSMGMAYTSIANDFSATYWNPAGLGQIRMSEVSLGLSHQSYGNTSTFLGNTRSLDNSLTDLNNFGLVYPFPTAQGSLVFAVGYNRVNDFSTALSFDGFNPKSSIIQSMAPDGEPYPKKYVTMAERLALANADTSTGLFVSPIRDSLQQRGKVLEGGGLNNWTFAVAVEAARQLYLGVSLNVVSGSYTYNREYIETDIFDKYNKIRFGNYYGNDYSFKQLNLVNTINGDISGFTARFGMLYKFNTGARIGINIKTPTFINVRENFSTDGTSTFDVVAQGRLSYNDRLEGKTEYDVTTPFVFSGGISVPISDLMIAGDVEFTDWTQMKFSNADPSVEQYNTDIKTLFRPTANLRVGAEYEFDEFRLRGGFAYLPSPYRGDPSSFAQKYITAGLGFIVQGNVAIDIGYAYGFWDARHVNYLDVNFNDPTTFENITTHSLMATVSYRF